MPILKGKSQPKTESKPAEQQDDFAKRYNETEAATGSGYVPPPPGEYNAFITEAQGIQKGKETSAYLEVTIVDPDDERAHGKKCRIYSNFTDKEGEDKGGMPFFKSNMAMLGHEEPINSWNSMLEILAEIVHAKIWVIINVVQKGKYTNIYLSSVPENQSEAPEADDLPF